MALFDEGFDVVSVRRQGDVRSPAPGPSTFDTQGLSGPDAFELWRGRGADVSAARMNDLEGEISSFFCRSETRQFGRVALVDVQMSPLVYRRTAARARKDGVDHIWLELDRGAANRIETPAGESVVGAGSVYACDLSSHFTRRVFESTCVGLYLDRGLFSDTELAALTGKRIVGARARMLRGYMESLASALSSEAAAIESSTAAVVTATIAGSADRAHEAAAALGPLALLEARRFIDRNLGRQSVSMAEVVAATQVSRATLYRLFQPYGGLSRFMWSRRLEWARRVISDPLDCRTLAEISVDLGFSSHANFVRAFRQEFGVKPSDLRPFRR